MKEIVVFVIIFIVPVFWAINLYKLTQCDFSADTSIKCEVVHGIGIMPGFSIGTVWFGTDK